MIANQNYHKNRDTIFLANNISVGNDLEICRSGRNEGPIVVVVDEFSKLSSCDDGEEHDKHMGDHLVANEETIEKSAENDGRV